MDTDPEAVQLVGEKIHVVIAGADRAELVARQPAQALALLQAGGHR